MVLTLFVGLSLFHPKGVNESEPFRWISAVPSIHAPVPTKGGKRTFGVLDLLKFQMTRTAASHTVRNTHIGCDVNLVRLNGKENESCGMDSVNKTDRSVFGPAASH